VLFHPFQLSLFLVDIPPQKREKVMVCVISGKYGHGEPAPKLVYWQDTKDPLTIFGRHLNPLSCSFPNLFLDSMWVLCNLQFVSFTINTCPTLKAKKFECFCCYLPILKP